MEEIKVTVVMPIYNVEPWLCRAIESVAAQTYQNLEILLVDDGSTDGSGKICDQYVQVDKRIRVIHKENKGLSNVRNVGIEQATGDYIGFVDGDDYIDADTIELQVKNIEKYGAEIVCCGFYLETETGHKTLQNGTGEVIVCTGEEGKNYLLRGHYAFPSMCNKLYARRLFPYIKNDESIRYTEDYLANYFAIQQASCVVAADVCKYHYVQRKGSYVMAKLNEGQFDAIRVSDIIMAREGDSHNMPFCVRRRMIIVLSLINRMIKSGDFQDRMPELRKEVLQHKNEILTSGLYGKKERFSAVLLSRFPMLYALIVKMKYRIFKI